MPRTVKELLEEAGRDARETVAAADRRWRQQVRELVRFLTGLKLSHRRGLEREQFLVPVRIKEGLPQPLQDLASEELPSYDEWTIELIALWKQDIEVLRSTSERLAHLCVELASLPTWEQRGIVYGEAVERTETIALELARYAAMATVLKRVVSIDEDVLGVYRFGSGGGEIHLYWLVIGATARLLGVDVEGLTVTALAHEMAHAYTHLGMDIDGRSWKDSFRKCDSAVVEAIAQYYTHKSLELLKKDGYLKG